jgi:tetratricopeptide (TPR) repeat protein
MLSRLRAFYAGSLLILMLCPAIARAQRHHGKPPTEGEPDEKQQAARGHYEKGLTHYNLGEFEQAVTEFKQAYELSNAPGLLFNIAQAYRAKEDYKQALHFYHTYLRLVPGAPNRADVEARIADLERLQEEKQRVAQAPPRDPITPEKAGPTTEPAPSHEETRPLMPAQTTPAQSPPEVVVDTQGVRSAARTKKLAGLVTAGAGVALVATGVVFGLSASSSADDLAGTTRWTPAAQSKYDDGDSASTRAVVLMVAGAAAVVTGGVLYYLGFRQDSSSFAVVPVPGGSAMVMACRF